LAIAAIIENVRIGTASWTEPEFIKAGWYPPGLPAGERLAFYAERFDMVELNSSFYAIPAAKVCERWVQQTPEGFLFDVKCHRLLSRHATKVDALPPDLRDHADTADSERDPHAHSGARDRRPLSGRTGAAGANR
jgi:uncharacterized protein YecE (DUF72 family)